jgi:N6-adenosine-specific RNA methylase IME4
MYGILYADPPWDYKGQTQFMGDNPTSSAERHYPTMTLAELKTLDVGAVCADDALLFLWSSSPHLPQALDLLSAWGFAYATVAFVWDKQRANPGYYTLSQCELCVVGKRGRIPQPRGARNVRQFLSEMRGEHSAKPAEVRRRIEAMFPTQRKLELFARTAADGWDCWGNEVTSTVTIPRRDK